MKRIKRMLCVLAVIALFSTMATTALVATLTFSEVVVSVTKNSTKTDTLQVNDGLVAHFQGIADTVPYTLATSDASHTLDTSYLNSSNYTPQILTTYEQEGFKRSVAVNTSGNVVIPAFSASGMYVLMLSYTYGTATWEVMKDSAYIESGYIAEAPISMGIAAVMQ